MMRYRISEEGTLEPDCGPGPPPGLRATPPLYFLAALVATVLVWAFVPGPALPGSFVPWLGGLIIGAGLWLNVAGSRQFADEETPIRPFTRSTALVTGGVFVVSRNPMYLGMALVLVGASFALGHVGPLGVAVAFAWLVDRHFIRHEEAMLEREFGSAYRDYRARVRRWV